MLRGSTLAVLLSQLAGLSGLFSCSEPHYGTKLDSQHPATLPATSPATGTVSVSNGIQVFTKGMLPPVPASMTDATVISLYGFRLVTLGDKQVWAAATLEDYRDSEARRLGIPAAAVAPRTYVAGENCYSTIPPRCYLSCPVGAGFCTSVYNPDTQHYYCVCTY